MDSYSFVNIKNGAWDDGGLVNVTFDITRDSSLFYSAQLWLKHWPILNISYLRLLFPRSVLVIFIWCEQMTDSPQPTTTPGPKYWYDRLDLRGSYQY